MRAKSPLLVDSVKIRRYLHYCKLFINFNVSLTFYVYRAISALTLVIRAS